MAIFSFAVLFSLSTADMGKLISSVRCKSSLILEPYHYAIGKNNNINVLLWYLYECVWTISD